VLLPKPSFEDMYGTAILPRIITPEFFEGSSSNALLPEEISFAEIQSSIILSQPVTVEIFKGITSGVNLPLTLTTEGFRGVVSSVIFPEVIMRPNFSGAVSQVILPEILPQPSFIGVTGRVILPEILPIPSFEGIFLSILLPEEISFAEIQGSIILSQPVTVDIFNGITSKTTMPIVEQLVIKEIISGTKIELMFPGGKDIIPTYGIGIPLGVERPLMDTKIRLEKEKEE
jgi:hypothetical protein